MYRDYFYDREKKSFHMDQSILDDIKKLEPVVKESGYYSHMVTWAVEKDADEILKHMQFLSMTSGFTDEIYKKYDLDNKKYLINMLTTLYLENDEDSNEIIMGYKRPFGNSHVLGDVREELVYAGVIEEIEYDEDADDDYDEDDYQLEEEVIKEFSEFISDFYRGGFKVRWYGFNKVHDSWGYSDNNYWKNLGIDRVHSYLTSWEFSKSEAREIQIDKILDGTL